MSPHKLAALTQCAGKVEAQSKFGDTRRRCAAQAQVHRHTHVALDSQRLIGNRATSNLIQAALTLSRPGDRFEQEADRVAADVATCFDSISAFGVSVGPSAVIERTPSMRLGRSAGNANGLEVAPDVVARIDAARGSGQALPEGVRATMEPLFGADFRGVRVHADARAAVLNRALEARAFTTGRDVFFGHGQYQPASRHGIELLAHELTHVVQQQAAAPATGTVMRALYEEVGAGGLVAPDLYQTESFDYNVGGTIQKRERPSRVSTRLWNAKGTKVTPDPIAFISDANVVDNIAGYHRGHIVGYTLGGCPQSYNIVPMLPRFNGSDWKTVENELAKATARFRKGDFKLDVEIDYTGSADPRVPQRFVLTAQAQVRDGVWENAGDPVRKNHEVIEPDFNAMEIGESYLAHVHKAQGDLKTVVAQAFERHLADRLQVSKPDAKKYGEYLREKWHLPAVERLYPMDRRHRPYEELDLLAFAGALSELSPNVAQIRNGAFTDPQKAYILEFNLTRHKGQLHSDDPTDEHQVLLVGGRGNRPEIDHIIPGDRGGSNFFSNAKVISFDLNNKEARIKNPLPFLPTGTVEPRGGAKLPEIVEDVLANKRLNFETVESICAAVHERRGTSAGRQATQAVRVKKILRDLFDKGKLEMAGDKLRLKLPSYRMDEF